MPIMVYIFPRISELKNSYQGIVCEQNYSLHLSFLLITSLIALFILFRIKIIILFFSKDFLVASPLIPIFLIGREERKFLLVLFISGMSVRIILFAIVYFVILLIYSSLCLNTD